MSSKLSFLGNIIPNFKSSAPKVGVTPTEIPVVTKNYINSTEYM